MINSLKKVNYFLFIFVYFYSLLSSSYVKYSAHSVRCGLFPTDKQSLRKAISSAALVDAGKTHCYDIENKAEDRKEGLEVALIGIDLGTTNSLGVVYRNNRAELIPNQFGSFLTPSVVSVDENGAVITGAVAKERLITHPECTAASFKKFMGTDKTWNLGGKSFTPEELSSFVVRSIVEDAENYLGEKVEEAVISVPAYFHDRQRTAAKKAGALAGVQVNRIINEPSAAALASYFDTDMEQVFLVFDFGGGTLDIYEKN